MLAERDGGQFGGKLPAATVEVISAFNDISFRPERKVTAERVEAAKAFHWSRGDKVFVDFPNTAIYPPAFYTPAALAIAAMRAKGSSVIDSLIAARIVIALFCIALATLAISLAGAGSYILFAILCLPMTLSLFGSLSQDGPIIATLALVVALCTGIVGTLRPASRILAALALGCVAAAKLPYTPLIGLLLLSPLRPKRADGRTNSVALILLIALAAGVLCLWLAFGAVPLKAPFRVAEGVDPSAQLQLLLDKPGSIFGIASETFFVHGKGYADQFIGVLGWLDTRLPEWSYHTAWGAFALAVVLGISGDTFPSGPERASRRIIALAIFLACVGLVFSTLYLVWTPVGNGVVEGVQGRYFLGPALVLALVFASLAPLRILLCPRTLLLALMIMLSLFSAWQVPSAIIIRYWI
jgi:uncharacterized membrane protein